MRGKGIHSKSIFVQLIVFSLLTSLVPIFDYQYIFIL